MVEPNDLTLGVVGSAGPEAPNRFCELLIRSKPSLNDQDDQEIPLVLDQKDIDTSLHDPMEVAETQIIKGMHTRQSVREMVASVTHPLADTSQPVGHPSQGTE